MCRPGLGTPPVGSDRLIFLFYVSYFDFDFILLSYPTRRYILVKCGTIFWVCGVIEMRHVEGTAPKIENKKYPVLVLVPGYVMLLQSTARPSKNLIIDQGGMQVLLSFMTNPCEV